MFAESVPLLQIRIRVSSFIGPVVGLISAQTGGQVMYSFDTLEIHGHRGLAVPNTFYRLEKRSDRLALVFPGRGYTSQAPLLHYTISTLTVAGFNVLSVNYSYLHNKDFESLEREDQMRWLYDDVEAAYQAATKKLDVEVEVLIGKSLGTMAIGYLLDKHPRLSQCKVVWHTPLILLPELQQQIKNHHPQSLFVIGTADPHYDQGTLTELVESTNGEAVVVEDANHAMEVPGEVNDSLWVIGKIIDSVGEFLRVTVSEG